MENDRQTVKKSNDDENDPMEDDETVYVSALENPAEITIRLEQERKRKITIISECEPSEKRPITSTPQGRRRDITDLRRQALVNNAIRSQASSTSRSRSRSRSRGRSVSRHRSLTRTRSRSGEHLRESRRSRSVVPSIPIEPSVPSDVALRLPTDLCNKSVLGSRAPKNPHECIELPSPLYILTEQQVTGASEKKIVQFVTKILLTRKKLSLDERKSLYAEMIEAEYVGTSRSSSDLSGERDDESEEEFQSRIYYSDKGIYIHTVQNVQKIRSGKKSTVSEEKCYSNICKTKVIGEHGKAADGWLNVVCSETVSVVDQLYTRTEQFKIGLRDFKVDGNVRISSMKSTFDPTKTVHFNEQIMFDNKNIGVLIRHDASAEMKNMWNHSMGSFGEEQSEYRELRFFFNEHEMIEKTAESLSVLTIPSPNATSSAISPAPTRQAIASALPAAAPTPKVPPPVTPIPVHKALVTPGRVAPIPALRAIISAPGAAPSSVPPRRSRSRSKRSRSAKRSVSATRSDTNARSSSPDRQSSKMKRPDEAPLKLNPARQDESLYHSLPLATSTPNSSVLEKSTVKQVTPDEHKKKRGSVTIREHRLSPIENEVDLDKSLNSKKKEASKNLSSLVETMEKKEGVRKQHETPSVLVSKPASLSGSSLSMTAGELYKDRVASANKSPASTSTPTIPSPQGTLRVKETKVTREVRQEDGKPAEISEKKEETVKEEKVKLSAVRGRSKSPATPTAKIFEQKTQERNVVILSAVKTTHQSLEITPIKVSSSDERSSTSSQKSFEEPVQLDMLIDGKRLVLNMKCVLLAEKRPEVEVLGFSFRGQKLWEKSSEWSISSANSTSQTKTIARQASNILDESIAEKKK